MKHLISLLILVAAAVNLLAGESQDNKSLQGEWVPAKAEVGGQALPDDVLKTMTLKLANGTYDVLVGGAPDKGTYELDAAATPKGMVIKGTDGPNKGKTIPAIYELQGETLRICYDLSGAQRPKEFKSETGTMLCLITYQRKK
jgi:uncharacterized protein (TIGR03067 family)